jgi:hypothetical protein
MYISVYIFLFGGKMYDVLWGAVFAFACLNIFGLVAKQFETGRTRISLGEMLAISAAVISLVMLGGELLFFFHLLPIRLEPR